jgi:hypothetical protein
VVQLQRLNGAGINTVSWSKELTKPGPPWHRAVYAAAAAPALLFALMGWEHGAYMTFGVLGLICLGLAAWPARVGAAVLFWPFAAGACLYGWLLAKDLVVLAKGGAPAVLLDLDDSVVFLAVELTLIAVAALFLIMWRPLKARMAR